VLNDASDLLEVERPFEGQATSIRWLRRKRGQMASQYARWDRPCSLARSQLNHDSTARLRRIARRLDLRPADGQVDQRHLRAVFDPGVVTPRQLGNGQPAMGAAFRSLFAAFLLAGRRFTSLRSVRTPASVTMVECRQKEQSTLQLSSGLK
jgi:hypothetical protein